ncbi:Ribosomal protein S30 [Spironucleus salmonicida]|uniref:40S ribosomal protein S30 n=1 Tax=Spironucleus salmonicida TaxID=348837 RepID=V6LXS5_9EUKA|nr:Ribosomal protein S30 [Spironucleus salmonicida]|eukprot:EST48516.1 Ribosomal protein S30 [Spironucleus salmonicida]
MARAHGGLSSAGKVRKQTPKVEKQPKARSVRGRALLNKKYKKFFLSNDLMDNGKQLTPNSFIIRKKRGLVSE